MSKHNETGANGEKHAEKFLTEKGYTILHRNWRRGRMEVDLIAQNRDVLVFIEVKTRSRIDFGHPEEAVGHQKKTLLKMAADSYLDPCPEQRKVQFDIVSIRMDGRAVGEIVHFEDAFY